MVGERKRKGPQVQAEAMESARQAFLGNSKEDFESDVISQEEESTAGNPIDEEIGAIKEEHEEPKSRHTDIELEAMDLGWVPKNEFRGDKSKWREAKVWVDNTKFYETIHAQKKEIESLKKGIIEISEFIKSEKVEKTQLTITELRQRRREAITNADVDAVEDFDRQIEEVNAKMVPSPASMNPPEVDEFLSRNSWFLANAEMQEYAKAAENRIKRFNPQMPISERLQKVEDETLRFFNKIESKESQNVSSVEARRAPIARDNQPRYDDLPQYVQKLVDHYVKKSDLDYRINKRRSKPLTREQYIANLIKLGTLDKSGNLITQK